MVCFLQKIHFRNFKGIITEVGLMITLRNDCLFEAKVKFRIKSYRKFI